MYIIAHMTHVHQCRFTYSTRTFWVVGFLITYKLITYKLITDKLITTIYKLITDK